jgi:hypothetical protein
MTSPFAARRQGARERNNYIFRLLLPGCSSLHARELIEIMQAKICQTCQLFRLSTQNAFILVDLERNTAES